MLFFTLHEIAGEEGEYPRYDCASIRTFGFCYDLRHVLHGAEEYGCITVI